MTATLSVLSIITICWIFWGVMAHFDTDSPINGQADLPSPKIKNTNNLDWTENEYKWDSRPPIKKAVIDFDIDPEVAAQIRARVKR